MFGFTKNMKIQWNLYKINTTGAWKKCPLYRNVHSVENPSENEYLAKN